MSFIQHQIAWVKYLLLHFSGAIFGMVCIAIVYNSFEATIAWFCVVAKFNLHYGKNFYLKCAGYKVEWTTDAKYSIPIGVLMIWCFNQWFHVWGFELYVNPFALLEAGNIAALSVQAILMCFPVYILQF